MNRSGASRVRLGAGLLLAATGALGGFACGSNPSDGTAMRTGAAGAGGSANASGAGGLGNTAGSGAGAGANTAGNTAAGSNPGVGGNGSGGSPIATGGLCTEPQRVLPKPELVLSLVDSFHEGWLASPAVADLDADGKNEIIAARGGRVIVWGNDGKKRWSFDATGRIWASPVVADLTPAPGLEIAFAARDHIYILDQAGNVQPGFPVVWKDELRSIAAADVDGDGKLDLVVSLAKGGGQPDIVAAYRADGTKVAGFPPNEAKASGCDDKCYRAGCYDQNLAVADVDGDGKADVFAPHDNAYASFHKGTGEAFDANAAYPKVKKTPGVRYLHALAEAAQGYAEDEDTALQAHFTNTAPALADLDGDGKLDVIMLGSVQNAAQSKRELGVGLWAVHADAGRLAGFETPVHFPFYMAGLWDFEGTNVVGATNQVSVADITAGSPGPEIVFAGFDGVVHAVSASGKPLWGHTFTNTPQVLTGGVVLGDLDADGGAEVVYATYSPEKNRSAVYIVDPCGRELAAIVLPDRGAMPVPTLADVDGDGTVEIVISLKDAQDGAPGVLVYRVPGSNAKYLPWPTGRGNLRRSGTASP